VTCTTTPPVTFSVGGTTSGLSGTVVLQNNGGDNLSVTTNGAFAFATKLASGGAYSVTVLTQPSGQACAVSGGTGTVASANVTSVVVTCAASGGTGTATDDFNRANGALGSSWTAMSDGAMTISSQVVAGGNSGQSGDTRTAEAYTSNQYSQVQVTSTQLTGGQWIGPAVRSQNSGQNLYLGIYFWNSGSPQLRLYKRTSGGFTQLGASFATSALATGATLKLTATGTTISFLLNGTPVITVTDTSLTGGAPGIVAFGTAKADNWAGGNIAGGASFTVGGTLSGLSGTVVLNDNGGDALSLTANGAFAFATPVPAGSPYNVTVASAPAGQTCAVSGGSGTVGSGNVTTVGVTCTTSPPTIYSVGGTVSGLSGTVVLQDNGADSLSLTASGSFAFATKLASGAAYAVTVRTQPTGQTCAVSGGSGTVGSANVTTVVVTCTASSGGGSGLQVQFLSTDASGVQHYQVTSPDNGPGPQTLRVLQPSNPAPGVAHNFIYVLPVEPGEGTTFGDGLQVIQSLGLQNQDNLTVIEPSFAINPWYADNPVNASQQEDTFMATDLQPWVQANLSTTGTEQHWLIGFSKSGIGAQTLILRHPDKFTLAASWDFPADMNTYDEYGDNSAESYGTDANFQANYRLTQAFLAAHAAPFRANNRIWIGSYQLFRQDVADYDPLLTSQGILHTTEPPTAMAHAWDSGWVPIALAALRTDSVNFH
jgi:Putative esterase